MYDPILYNVIYLIANEPLELSHEKVHAQLRQWKKLAQKALEEWHNPDPDYSEPESGEEGRIHDDF